jgi:DNA helicase-2/ATP-dependent DNA helicase PcrA
MWVGTFHGLCNRMLRAHYRDAGLPSLFQILDSQDQLALVKRLMKAMNLDEERFPPRQAAWFIAGQKEEGRRAKDVEPYDEFTHKMVEVYAAYDQQCQREGVVDFGELMLRSYELLERNETLRDHYRNRFGHVLVDEFQDTNKLQYRWLQLLAGRDNFIFAVGDDDQSIYAFRGASTANMQHLQRDFHIDRIIKLEQNYRSHAHILDAANALIAHNRKRLGKNLWTAEGKGEPLRVFEAATDIEEAAYVVDEVKRLHAEGVRLGEIGVLYRSNAQSRVLEHALFNASLPYRVYGGLRFFERQEVKHALAYLRLIASPDDDGAWLRIVNFPPRGIGARGVEQVQEVARERGISLWAAACANTLSGKSGASVAGFVRLVENMRAATAGRPLPEVIEHVVQASGLEQHYRNEREGADRLENLAELTNAAATFVGERDVRPTEYQTEGDEPVDELTAFLTHAALESGEHQAASGADALQLMTVHSAKGLEFHTVFVGGLEEGLFPHENSLTEADGMEEERRLMYVALTRARRRLYLTHAQSRMLHGQTRFNVPSRFFQEIPPTLMRRIKPVTRPAYGAYGGRARAGVMPVQPGVPWRDAGMPWRIGQSVTHPKFGAGVIVSAEGRGPDARVQVNFRDSGLKWLMLEYAKLAPA